MHLITHEESPRGRERGDHFVSDLAVFSVSHFTLDANFPCLPSWDAPSEEVEARNSRIGVSVRLVLQ